MDPNRFKRPAIPSQITILPSCLITDILSRLPINTLYDCKCVSKTWNNFISDLFFTQLHLTNSPPGILIKIIRRRGGESRQLLLAQINGGNTKSRFMVEKMKFNSEDHLPNYQLEVVNSVNGLICLSGSILIADQVYICNPILDEHIAINIINNDDSHYKCKGSFGFGFCAETAEYKVIHTFNVMESYKIVQNYQEAEVYTVGTGKWRRIDNPPCKITSTLPVNTFLNGSIHWINSSDSGGFGLVYAFNFGIEKFKEIPLPTVLAPKGKKMKRVMKVGVLRDCLCLCSSFSKRSDLWVMKEYGVKKSWSKMYVVENLCLNKRSFKFCEAILSFDSENILMLCGNSVIACYNVKTKKFRDAKICQTIGEFQIYSHIPSFVSLEDIAEVEKVRISRQRMRTQGYFFSY
ncbi:F-box/kelch-repeat protein At3g06240 [Mercurialis annua]|uniref:F-box/kelch-repeat protein At3g06240 n=1 Tax=Mercurialis annua TaxID=3986 RepID=UPI00215EC787|nr:F-box/kelch-repeat protein At3g06240 [Mercurialis annua]